jgi:hypothetical protein
MSALITLAFALLGMLFTLATLIRYLQRSTIPPVAPTNEV